MKKYRALNKRILWDIKRQEADFELNIGDVVEYDHKSGEMFVKGYEVSDDSGMEVHNYQEISIAEEILTQLVNKFDELDEDEKLFFEDNGISEITEPFLIIEYNNVFGNSLTFNQELTDMNPFMELSGCEEDYIRTLIKKEDSKDKQNG